MPAGATERIVAWLTEADLTFFGACLARIGQAEAHRIAFWHRALDAVRVSRVLLCPEDELRFATGRAPGGAAVAFGRVTGGDSVLVLCFDRVLALDRARSGVVELYARLSTEEPTDLLAADPAAGLDRRRVRVARVARQEGWETALRQHLATHGAVVP